MYRRIGAALLAILLLAAVPAAAFAEETGTDPAALTEEGATTETQETEQSEPADGAGATEAPTMTPEAAATPEAATTPETSPTPEAAATAEPSATPEPVQTTPEPAATATPEPAATATPTATPIKIGEQCVTMGADLTEAQREAVYRDFGIEPGSVQELQVTNQEEREYLEGLVPDGKIGSVALSCIYITLLEPGAGLDIQIYNINYCTEQMYKNALTTAGITDARVVVSAPFPVSGTGALTGAYKAYESLTGVALNDLAKLVGAEELVVTGELAEYVGSAEATEIVAQLKNILDQTQQMTDAEVRDEIRSIAAAYNVTITDTQVEQLLTLTRKLEGLDTDQLQQRLTGLAKTAQSINTVSETISRVYESVKDFFAAIGDFFVRLFGGGQ